MSGRYQTESIVTSIRSLVRYCRTYLHTYHAPTWYSYALRVGVLGYRTYRTRTVLVLEEHRFCTSTRTFLLFQILYEAGSVFRASGTGRKP